MIRGKWAWGLAEGPRDFMNCMVHLFGGGGLTAKAPRVEASAG